VALVPPLRVTVVPLPFVAGLIVPDMLNPVVLNVWPTLFPLLFFESVELTS
jgi:hypothetical protein